MTAVHRDMLTHFYVYSTHKYTFTYMTAVNRDMLTHTYSVHRDEFN